MLPVAVVGVGHLGRHHARWLKKLDGVQLVGVYDKDQERSRAIANELEVKAFVDLDDVKRSVKACSVVVSTAFHYDVARELLDAGIHCLVEKPLAATLEQARELVELSERKKLILTVGHIERFNPAVRALDGMKISPRFIEAHRLAAFNPRGADVAVILDLMIHDIELCLHFVDSEITRIDASSVAVVSDSADIANARLTFANGSVANLTASRISLQAMRKLRIFQPAAYYSLDLAEQQADIYRLDGQESFDDSDVRIPLGQSGKDIVYSKPKTTEEDMLCAELSAFTKSVIQESRPLVSAAGALKALEVALEIERKGAAHPC